MTIPATRSSVDGGARGAAKEGDVGRLVHGRYRLEAVLGRGGMGTVYAARHEVTGRRVAVKLLHPRPDWSAAEVERLLREARISARLGHPNVIEVVDAGTDEDGAPFIAMELLRGESLRARLEREGRFDVATAIRVARAVLSALAAAHDAGIVHRDVKPENVFLALREGDDERVLLLDFGISKVLKSHNGSIAPETLTETGAIVGTVAYMSPEQLRGEEVDGRSDLWATGVLLYELLTGRTPFTGKTPALLTMSILMARAPSLDKAARGLPKPLVSLVAALLSPKREGRPERASAALATLDEIRDLPPPDAVTVLPPLPEETTGTRSRARGRTWLAVFAALSVTLGLLAWRLRSPERVSAASARPIDASPQTSPAASHVASAVVLPPSAVDASVTASVVDASVDGAARAARRVSPTHPARAIGRPASQPIAPAVTVAPTSVVRPMQPATDLNGT